jgi:hypothetical protein
MGFCRNVFALKKTELSMEKLQQCPRSFVLRLDDGIDQMEQVRGATGAAFTGYGGKNPENCDAHWRKTSVNCPLARLGG